MSKIQFALIAIGTALAQLFGGWDTLLQALILMVILDYLTGFMAAAYQGKLASGIGYRGIIKKVSIFVVVLIACNISKSVGTDLIRNATIMFYVSNEGLSILENIAKTGVEYPDVLKRFLKNLNKKDGVEDEHN